MMTLAEIRNELSGGNALASFLWNNAREGWALVSKDGVLEHLSPSFARMLGYTRSQLEGRKFQEITVAEDVEGDVIEFRRLLAGEITEYEFVKAYKAKVGTVTCRLRAIDFERGVLVVGTILPVDVLSLEHLPEAEQKRVLAMLIGRWAVENWKLLLIVLFAAVSVLRIDDVAKIVSGL